MDGLGRGQYIVEAMMAGLCPDCQTKLMESTDLELEEFKDDGAKTFECPRCHWQGILGGSCVAALHVKK
jgi:hypothetical protein